MFSYSGRANTITSSLLAWTLEHLLHGAISCHGWRTKDKRDRSQPKWKELVIFRSSAYGFTVDGNPETARFRRLRENNILMKELPSHAFHKGNRVPCQPASIYLRLRVKMCKWQCRKTMSQKCLEFIHIYKCNLWNLDILFFFTIFIFSFLWTLDILPSALDILLSTHDPRPKPKLCKDKRTKFLCSNNIIAR